LRLLYASLVLACGPVGAAGGAEYPSRPIRFIVPFGTGGAADITARTVAQKLSDALGQPLVVDNRSGAGGIIGTDLAAKSASDGYTLVLGSFGTHTANPSLYRTLSYDPVRDFAPISLVATVPLVLVVHPSVPAASVQELIALARAKPGSLNYASSGTGTGTHLAGELFKVLTDTDMVHVPYKSAGTAVSDVTGGQVQLMFSSLPSVLPLVKGGKLRALGISTPGRSRSAPGIAPIAGALPGYDVGTWFGMLAPANTDPGIVALVSRHVVRIVGMSDTQERFVALGAEPVGSTAEEFAQYIRTELPKWAKVIRSAGITAQ
jgi:tripartite-type tricarboxylate transporter receptor subunit TctC